MSDPIAIEGEPQTDLADARDDETKGGAKELDLAILDNPGLPARLDRIIATHHPKLGHVQIGSEQFVRRMRTAGHDPMFRHGVCSVSVHSPYPFGAILGGIEVNLAKTLSCDLHRDEPASVLGMLADGASAPPTGISASTWESLSSAFAALDDAAPDAVTQFERLVFFEGGGDEVLVTPIASLKLFHEMNRRLKARRGKTVRTSPGASGKPSEGRGALLDAALAGNTQLVEELLATGADPSPADADGATPLHLAAATGDVETVRALLAGGADPNARSSGGWTAAECAALAQHHDTVEVLEDWGGHSDQVVRQVPQAMFPLGGSNPQNVGYMVLSGAYRNTGHHGFPVLLCRPPQDSRSPAQRTLARIGASGSYASVIRLDRAGLLAYGRRAAMQVDLSSHRDAELAHARDIAAEFCEAKRAIENTVAAMPVLSSVDPWMRLDADETAWLDRRIGHYNAERLSERFARSVQAKIQRLMRPPRSERRDSSRAFILPDRSVLSLVTAFREILR